MRTHAEGTTVDREGWLSDCAHMRIHLIGVGGSGMSGAASLLLALGVARLASLVGGACSLHYALALLALAVASLVGGVASLVGPCLYDYCCCCDCCCYYDYCYCCECCCD